MNETIINNWINAINDKNIAAIQDLYNENATHKSFRLEMQQPKTRGVLYGNVSISQWWERVFKRLPSIRYQKINIISNADKEILVCKRIISAKEEYLIKIQFIFNHGRITSSEILTNTKHNMNPNTIPLMHKNVPFYFINNIYEAIEAFVNTDFTSPEEGDSYFQEYCPGNTSQIINVPFERFNDYENLLLILKSTDEKKYDLIHKGTPFYFMAWISFYMKIYERAVYYMDAAISEDIRQTIFFYRLMNIADKRSNEDLSELLIIKSLERPAGHFITLKTEGNQAAQNISIKLNEEWEKHLLRFNKISGTGIVTSDIVKNYFLKLAENPKARSLLTALNSFILEYNDVKSLIKLRSIYGGSIEPITTYLLKGGLIFESILKTTYPQKDDNNGPTKTIGDISKIRDFQTKYFKGLSTSASTLSDILHLVTTNDLQTAFNTTAKLRNTTGHNLQWDDIFNDDTNFTILFEQIVNAILFTYLISYHK